MCRPIFRHADLTERPFFKPSWAGKTAVALNGESLESSEKEGFVAVDATLKAGDTLQYSFEQEPYWADTHNIHTVEGYQKVYQGPLMLGTMNKNKKEITLPKNAKLSWDSEAKEIEIGNVKLSPINVSAEQNLIAEMPEVADLWHLCCGLCSG